MVAGSKPYLAKSCRGGACAEAALLRCVWLWNKIAPNLKMRMIFVQGFHVDVSSCGVAVLSGNGPCCGMDEQYV